MHNLSRIILGAAVALTVSQTALGQERPNLTVADSDSILAFVGGLDADVVVVNMWATWCGPCVEEMPDFIRYGKHYRNAGVEMIFVSVDFEEATAEAADRLLELGWDRAAFLKSPTQKDNDFVNSFSDEWSGAVPATFVYERNGNLLGFWQAQTTYDELAARVSEYRAGGTY